MQHLTGTSISCTSAAFAELTCDLLRAGKAVRFEARGGSMAPLVRDGDVLLVRPVDGGSVRVGDVVLYSSQPGRVLVHRVVCRLAGPDGPRFAVQGDAVSQPDGVIPGAEVYGRVVAIERGGAHIDMDNPVMSMLGWAAALRSRWRLARGDQLRWVRQFVKTLPVLCRYLA